MKSKRNNARIHSQSGAFLLFGLDAVLDEKGTEEIKVMRVVVSNKKKFWTNLIASTSMRVPCSLTSKARLSMLLKNISLSHRKSNKSLQVTFDPPPQTHLSSGVRFPKNTAWGI